MPTTTVSDLETYRRAFAQEYPITRRLFAGFPEGKLDDLPSPSANSPRRLAWTIALTQLIVPAIMRPDLSPTRSAPLAAGAPAGLRAARAAGGRWPPTPDSHR